MYCCFNRSSFPASVPSPGYNTAQICSQKRRVVDFPLQVIAFLSSVRASNANVSLNAPMEAASCRRPSKCPLAFLAYPLMQLTRCLESFLLTIAQVMAADDHLGTQISFILSESELSAPSPASCTRTLYRETQKPHHLRTNIGPINLPALPWPTPWSPLHTPRC